MLIVHYIKKLHLDNQIETNNEWILNINQTPTFKNDSIGYQLNYLSRK